MGNETHCNCDDSAKRPIDGEHFADDSSSKNCQDSWTDDLLGCSQLWKEA